MTSQLHLIFVPNSRKIERSPHVTLVTSNYLSSHFKTNLKSRNLLQKQECMQKYFPHFS